MFTLSLNQILKLSAPEQTIYAAREAGYVAKSKGEPIPQPGVEGSAYNTWVKQGAEIYAYGVTNVLGHSEPWKE